MSLLKTRMLAARLTSGIVCSQALLTFYTTTSVPWLQNLPVWHTEIGYNLRISGASTQMAAAYIARSFVLSWALGVGTSCFYAYNAYALYESYEGLVKVIGPGNTDVKTLNDAGLAYKQVQVWLVGATLRSLSSNKDGVWVGELQRPAGSAGPQRSWMIWTMWGTASFPVPAGWSVAYQQSLIGGKNTALTGTTIPAGATPLLLVSSTA
jgi:hypothetical protein